MGVSPNRYRETTPTPLTRTYRCRLFVARHRQTVEFEATSDGGFYGFRNLIGTSIGWDMVNRAADRVKGLNCSCGSFDHIIVSHQGTKEWDSPEPMPRRLLVHFADDVDAN